MPNEPSMADHFKFNDPSKKASLERSFIFIKDYSLSRIGGEYGTTFNTIADICDRLLPICDTPSPGLRLRSPQDPLQGEFLTLVHLLGELRNPESELYQNGAHRRCNRFRQACRIVEALAAEMGFSASCFKPGERQPLPHFRINKAKGGNGQSNCK